MMQNGRISVRGWLQEENWDSMLEMPSLPLLNNIVHIILC